MSLDLNRTIRPAQLQVGHLIGALESRTGGIFDDPNVEHHEFSQKPGLHGIKGDFDKIETHSFLYNQVVTVVGECIKDNYDELPPAIAGVADGANRFAESIATYLGPTVKPLESEKHEKNDEIRLTRLGHIALEIEQPEWILLLDDMGTTGGNMAKLHDSIRSRSYWEGETEQLYIWQRQLELPELETRNLTNEAVILKEVETYTAEECKDHGPCSKKDVELIPHGQ